MSGPSEDSGNAGSNGIGWAYGDKSAAVRPGSDAHAAGRVFDALLGASDRTTKELTDVTGPIRSLTDAPRAYGRILGWEVKGTSKAALETLADVVPTWVYVAAGGLLLVLILK